MTDSDRRAFLRNLGNHAPGLLQGGATRLDRHYVFHWPTLHAAVPYAATLFELPVGASWEALREAALSCLPGRHASLDALSPDDLPQDEPSSTLTACEAPFCGLYFGRAPDPHLHDFSHLSHTLRQLYYALDDLSLPEGPSETGVWCDIETNRLVINWLMRAARYPYGHAKSPLRIPADNHWSVIAMMKTVSMDYVARDSSRAFRASTLRSPWGMAQGYLSVAHIEPLIDQFAVLSRRIERKPRNVATWPVFLEPSTVYKNPNSTKWVSFSAWLEKHELHGLPLKATWLRTQWGITLPAGAFSDAVRATVDLARRDALLAEYVTAERAAERARVDRSSKPRTVIFDPRANIFTYFGETYYTTKALEVFCQFKSDNFALFDAVRDFLVLAHENHSFIASAEMRRKRRIPHVADDKRKRAKRWTKEEDAALHLFFGYNEEEGTRAQMTEKFWELLYAKLDSGHRTERQVQNRITYLNACLYKSLLKGGTVLSLEARELYKKRRLGQRDRNL